MRNTFLGLACLLTLASTAGAAPLPTLYNTGVDASGALLVGGNGTTDIHWDVISGPGIISSVDAVTYLHPAYFLDGPNSRWISSTSGGGAALGTFVFQTTFDLTGFNLAAVTISVSCATDNLLNGVTLNGSSVTGDCDSFGGFAPPFAINTGFVAGVNTLQFTVVDQGSPMAFRAEFTSDGAPDTSGAIPEPGTWLLSTGAIACLGIQRLLRRRGKVAARHSLTRA